jgi:hypothetical protein
MTKENKYQRILQRICMSNGRKEGIISWSQYGQDQLIDKLLIKKRNGFFVEIGGYDGETFSYCLFLEKERHYLFFCRWL